MFRAGIFGTNVVCALFCIGRAKFPYLSFKTFIHIGDDSIFLELTYTVDIAQRCASVLELDAIKYSRLIEEVGELLLLLILGVSQVVVELLTAKGLSILTLANRYA